MQPVTNFSLFCFSALIIYMHWLRKMDWCIVGNKLFSKRMLTLLSDQFTRQWAAMSYPGNTSKCRQTCNISHTLVVGAAPTTSSFSTKRLASMDWAKTTARRDTRHLRLGILWLILEVRGYLGHFFALTDTLLGHQHVWCTARLNILLPSVLGHYCIANV